MKSISCIAISLFITGTAAINADETAVIQRAMSLLDQYKEEQAMAGIQDPNIAYGMRKAIVLADLLFDQNGKLDTALAKEVKPYFVPHAPLEYEVNIGHMLDQLNPSWESFFDTVIAPSKASSTSNLMLHALFGLPENEPLVDRQAKVAVLAALFSPYNQGPVGDCFAVADVVRDHEEYFRHSALDYASIVHSGYLTRKVREKTDNFFFLPTLADTNLSTKVAIDTTGMIAGTNLPFLSVPGFAVACSAMGGDGIADLSQFVLRALFSESFEEKIEIPASQVISLCADIIASNIPGVNADSLQAKGAYAFSCLTNNPVLKAVEDAFAAMAEDRDQDYVRGNINDCVAQAFSPVWQQLGQAPHVAQFQSSLTNHLNSSYRLVYNPNIPLPQVSADGNSTDGGFQLYQRDDSNPSSMGTRISTPEDFANLVLAAIHSTAKDFGTSNKEANSIAKTLTGYVNNGPFLRDALWSYDNANQQQLDPVSNYTLLSRTPMQSCNGDNPFEVADIDTQQNYDTGIQTFTPTNTAALINWCLNLAKTTPSELIPMTSPQHAFNFAPINSDIVSFLNSKMSSDQWLKKSLTVPGLTVATETISEEMQTAFANAVYSFIANALPDSGSYGQLLSSLAEQTQSVQSFAQGLLDGLTTLLNPTPAQMNQLALIVDTCLLQSLPSYESSLLQKTAVRFAFTNWNDGIKDIYFCAYFNPRSGKIAFGNIDEDKTRLQPMDELAWVNNQPWSVDPRPLAPKQ